MPSSSSQRFSLIVLLLVAIVVVSKVSRTLASSSTSYTYAVLPPNTFCTISGGHVDYYRSETACASGGARLCTSTEVVKLKLLESLCPNKFLKGARVWTSSDCAATVKISKGGKKKTTVSTSGKVVVASDGLGKLQCLPLDGTVVGIATYKKKISKIASIQCCKDVTLPPTTPTVPAVKRNNVVMIVVDDLRPDLGAYGRGPPRTFTPNMDAFAQFPGTLVFDRAYANYPQCCPSRASFLSGQYPDQTRVYAVDRGVLRNTLRETMVTFPQFFKNAGYNVQAGGKLYHYGSNDVASWSQPMFRPTLNEYTNGGLFPICLHDKASQPIYQVNGRPFPGGFMCSIVGQEDKVLIDGDLAAATIRAMQPLVNSTRPFFLGVGFYRPHLPFFVHEKYWNMVPNGGLSRIPKYPDADVLTPPAPRSTYYKFFFDPDPSFSKVGGNATPWQWKRVDPNFRKISRIAYSAAVTQADAMVGRVVKAIDDFGLTKNTLVMIFGDHGFNLGESGMWNKDVLFETALRVPLMIRVPWYAEEGASISNKPGPVIKRARRMFELIDLYRTTVGIMELEGADIPDYVDGQDHSGYIRDRISSPPSPVENTVQDIDYEEMSDGNEQYAFSQVIRCVDWSRKKQEDCSLKGRRGVKGQSQVLFPIGSFGYSARSNQWRYVVWLKARDVPSLPGETGQQQLPDWDYDNGAVLGEELYSHARDESTIFRYLDPSSYATYADDEALNLATVRPDVCRAHFIKIYEKFGEITP